MISYLVRGQLYFFTGCYFTQDKRPEVKPTTPIYNLIYKISHRSPSNAKNAAYVKIVYIFSYTQSKRIHVSILPRSSSGVFSTNLAYITTQMKNKINHLYFCVCLVAVKKLPKDDLGRIETCESFDGLYVMQRYI
jgi:hypothetical protein